MDKYDFVLDLVEHPDKYSDEDIAGILADSETKEIYTLLCKTGAALDAGSMSPAEVDGEWRRFTARNFSRHGLSGSRAASIAATIALVSLVSAGVGVTITLSRPEKTAEPVPAAEQPAAPRAAIDVDKTAVATDTTQTILAPVIYEDVELGTILTEIARHYGVTVEYGNKEAAGLHLYYKFDPTQSIDETVEQLNTFNHINIRVDGTTLTIY